MMHYEKDAYEELFTEYEKEGKIKKSNQLFKSKLFVEKAANSLLIAQEQRTNSGKIQLHRNYWAITIAYYAMLYAAKAAILSKGYEVSDHFGAQIALGYLFVPNTIEKEDLQLLGEAHKIFENEYISYFEDARIESNIA